MSTTDLFVTSFTLIFSKLSLVGLALDLVDKVLSFSAVLVESKTFDTYYTGLEADKWRS